MADTLVIAEELRERFSIAPEVTCLDFSISSASTQLKRWVGTDAYADALLADSAQDKERAAQLKDAESYLGAYHTLLNGGMRMRPSGVVTREQDAAGPMGGTVLNQYLTPKELSELRRQYMAQAEELAAPYRLQANSTRTGTMLLKGGWTG